jgi:hypothetical protein
MGIFSAARASPRSIKSPRFHLIRHPRESGDPDFRSSATTQPSPVAQQWGRGWGGGRDRASNAAVWRGRRVHHRGTEGTELVHHAAMTCSAQRNLGNFRRAQRGIEFNASGESSEAASNLRVLCVSVVNLLCRAGARVRRDAPTPTPPFLLRNGGGVPLFLHTRFRGNDGREICLARVYSPTNPPVSPPAQQRLPPQALRARPQIALKRASALMS